jgi:hypothetical protein
MLSPLDEATGRSMAERQFVIVLAGVVFKESTDSSRVGLAKGVDRLIVVADCQNGCPSDGKSPNHVQVARVKILILVHNEKVVVSPVEFVVVPQRTSE